jgi:hypothetical protein
VLPLSPELSDYDTLLKQYRLIKQRLENLQHEEDKVSEVLSDAIPLDYDGKDKTSSTAKVGNINIAMTMAIGKVHVVYM